MQGIVRKKTRVPQRTNEPSSEKIVHDGARLARIKPRRRHHAAPRPARQCVGVGGRLFCRWRHRPRLQCCPRYLWPTRHNFRHSDAPPPLQQRHSTPMAPSDGSQSPDRARQAREPSGERRLPTRWGRKALVTAVFLILFFNRILLFDACVVRRRNISVAGAINPEYFSLDQTPISASSKPAAISTGPGN